MIDLTHETLVRMTEGHKLPDRPHAGTLWRWIRFGKPLKEKPRPGVSGRGERKAGGKRKPPAEVRVYLEWAWYGSRRVTSVQAHERFMRRLNGEVLGEDHREWVK